MKRLVVIFLFLAGPCLGQKEAAKVRFDSGPVARIHWFAAAFDYSTTGAMARSRYFYEGDPLARPFVGHGSPGRLGVGFALEAVSVGFIPNRKIRRIVQFSAIGLHLWAGTRNLRR